MENTRPSPNIVDGEVRCPKGHAGPFWYVEAIEVWRKVKIVTDDQLEVEAAYQTGEGFDDGIPNSAYLLCRAPESDGLCVEEIQLPEDTDIRWK